jgi:endonuclease/exonuclease/phosphatase family metal-dependent hydrolase
MKVMSYNTLFGGRDGDDDHRFEAQREVVAREKPDILLLQECKNFDANGYHRLYEVEEALGMRGFLAMAVETGQHTAIFIRPEWRPVSFEGDSTHFHHAAAILSLRVPGFSSPVTFVSVHLCPFGPEVRLSEAAYLVPYASPEGLTLVAGDFNSVSPHDPEPDWSALPSHFRARYVSSDGQTADRRILQGLYQAGYTDVAHHLDGHAEPTVPGAAFPRSEFVPFRSDFFLASAALADRVVSYCVVRNPLTDMASDHYPIVAEFQH